MQIALTYCLVGQDAPREIKFTPEEYYDPLEPGESYWENGIERCIFLHEYLDVEPCKIKWIVARVSKDDRIRWWRVQLLDGDKAMMQHTVDEKGDEELILSTLLPNGVWHAARVLKPNDSSWTVTRFALDQDDSGESQDLAKNWSFQERLAFSKVGTPTAKKS